MIWRNVLVSEHEIQPCGLREARHMFRMETLSAADTKFQRGKPDLPSVMGTCRLFREDQRILQTFYVVSCLLS